MKIAQLILTTLLGAFLLNPLATLAEDIDIYSGLTASADLPNVLIILDTRAANNASTSGSCAYSDGGAPSYGTTLIGLEQCALYNVIDSLPTNADGTALLNIGLMMYNAGASSIMPAACSAVSQKGGCLVQPLAGMSTANKAALKAWIKTWPNTGSNKITTNSAANAQSLQEAWAYYAGQTGISGRNYSGIQPAAGCQKNFVIFLGNDYNANGAVGDGGLGGSSLVTPDGLSNITIPSGSYGLPTATAGVLSCGSYTMGTHSDSSGLYADEWARFMSKTDIYPDAAYTNNQSIITYTIAALGPACKPEPPALFKSMAEASGGKYYPVNGDNVAEITQAILHILNEVQAVNSVFASSSLPVSVNAQGTFLNQIYMGMFRPDPYGLPRWVGNLKQYQFGYDQTNRTLSLVDNTQRPAISGAGTTGFISADAASFWTCTNSTHSATFLATDPLKALPTCAIDPATGFWLHNQQGTGGAFDLPDGEVVEKGGAAQMLRNANMLNNYTAGPGTSTNPRKVYTYCPSGSGCNAQLSVVANVFDTTNAAITDTLLTTGPRTISSIVTAATVTPSSTVAVNNPPGISATPASISVTNFARAATTVTATVSAANFALISPTSTVTVATGSTKVDCSSCVITSTNSTAHTFTYTVSGGSGALPSSGNATISNPYSGLAYSTVTVNSVNHQLSVGQKITFASSVSTTPCTVLTALNNTIQTIVSTTTNTFTISVNPSSLSGTDYACKYSPNTAIVTTSTNHGFAAGPVNVTIAGASPAAYNGSWTITVTDSTHFTYQYASAAPLTSPATLSSATATSNTTSRDSLTKWVRGMDNANDEPSPDATYTTINVRPSIHGDVLHSRPTVINYGGSIGVVVFYGSNDGSYHAVNGNQTNLTGSTLPIPGSELWDFIPSEFYNKLVRQHDNSPVLSLPSTPSGIVPTPQKKDYFADGSNSVYQKINADGTTNTAYLYMAMRRGGRFIYALNVTTPTDPRFLWKIEATGDFTELGQTWSQPKVVFVKGYANPVLIFGAGYDAAYDDTEPPGSSASHTMGRGIFIVDAVTGVLVWKATYGVANGCSGTSTQATCTLTGMKYSIPADITLVDHTGNDGYIDRLYAADLGGNIWRVDLEPSASPSHITPNYWQVTRLAALGCDTGECASGTTPRKFFYSPDVVPTTGYDAVLAGSGDREHPLYTAPTSTNPPYAQSAYNKTNRFYMIKDFNTGNDGSSLTIPYTEASLTNITDTTNYTAICAGTDIDGDPNTPNPTTTSIAYDDTLSGYYITLCPGEKVVNAPLTVAGYTYFGTNAPKTPSSNSCDTNLGTAKGYQVRPLAGTNNYVTYDGGGLPPSPVAGSVNIEVNGTNMVMPFCIGCGGAPDSSCMSALCGAKPPISVSTSRSRTYWYKNTD